MMMVAMVVCVCVCGGGGGGIRIPFRVILVSIDLGGRTA